MPPQIYFSQVSFKGNLQTELNERAANNEFIVWDFNARQGFLMEKDSFKESSWFIPFTEISDYRGLWLTQFNFGDLLKLPIQIILHWEEYFLSSEVFPDNIRRILFPKTQKDAEFIKEHWRKCREQWEEANLRPWSTKEDMESYYAPEYDKVKSTWNGLRFLRFKKEVLDKYREDPLCRLYKSNEMILTSLQFLNNEEKVIFAVLFLLEGDKITIDADRFIEIPPKEREHWFKFFIEDKKLGRGLCSRPNGLLPK